MRVAFQHLDDEMHAYLLQKRWTQLYSTSSYCPWCTHDWHAERCSNSSACRCETARARLDDTWRPELNYGHEDNTRRIARDTGVDGYVARACVGVRPTEWTHSPCRLKNLVYGKGTDE